MLIQPFISLIKGGALAALSLGALFVGRKRSVNSVKEPMSRGRKDGYPNNPFLGMKKVKPLSKLTFRISKNKQLSELVCRNEKK